MCFIAIFNLYAVHYALVNNNCSWTPRYGHTSAGYMDASTGIYKIFIVGGIEVDFNSVNLSLSFDLVSSIWYSGLAGWKRCVGYLWQCAWSDMGTFSPKGCISTPRSARYGSDYGTVLNNNLVGRNILTYPPDPCRSFDSRHAYYRWPCT